MQSLQSVLEVDLLLLGFDGDGGYGYSFNFNELEEVGRRARERRPHFFSTSWPT
jgi:hypothetical protein